MFHNFLVNPNTPSFPLSPLSVPTKHSTALWFPTHISPYWDSHVFSCYFTGYSHWPSRGVPVLLQCL
jgi:hypothetical protein